MVDNKKRISVSQLPTCSTGDHPRTDGFEVVQLVNNVEELVDPI